MAFPRTVTDRVVQNPRRFQLVPVANTTDQYDLVPVTGVVTAEGTAINKAYLQPIEDAIDSLQTAVSPNNLLAAIKTVDGAGSGLDADQVKGKVITWEAIPKTTPISEVNFSSITPAGYLDLAVKPTEDIIFSTGANNATDQMYKTDMNGNILSQVNSPGAAPYGITYLGGYIYTCDYSTNTVYKMDENFNILASYNIGLSCFGMADDETNIYLATNTTYIQKISTSGVKLAQIPAAKSVAICYKDGYLWIRDYTNNTLLSKINPATGYIIESVKFLGGHLFGLDVVNGKVFAWVGSYEYTASTATLVLRRILLDNKFQIIGG